MYPSLQSLMPYRNKEEQKEYRREYDKLKTLGYALCDTYEPRKCPVCGVVFKPISKIHKFDKDKCRQNWWKRNR